MEYFRDPRNYMRRPSGVNIGSSVVFLSMSTTWRMLTSVNYYFMQLIQIWWSRIVMSTSSRRGSVWILRLSMNGWLITNYPLIWVKLSLIFGTKRKLARHSELIIKCGDNLITPKSDIKCLGLDIDQSLSGELQDKGYQKGQLKIEVSLQKRKIFEWLYKETVDSVFNPVSLWLWLLILVYCPFQTN